MVGPWVIPLISSGLGLLGSLFKGNEQQYRQTPLQQQLGGFMQRLLARGGTQMSPDLFAKYMQSYAVPQQAQWAMNILPQMFGGQSFGGQPTGASGFNPSMGAGGFNPFIGYSQSPMQNIGWGGQGGGGFAMNPFAMPFRV